jgi:F0F1-type ATP synthase assembly protein I
VIDRDLMRRVAGSIAMVSELAVTVILGVLAGGWLDRRFGTEPVLILFLSIGALIFSMWRLVNSLNRLFKPDASLSPTDSVSSDGVPTDPGD